MEDDSRVELWHTGTTTSRLLARALWLIRPVVAVALLLDAAAAQDQYLAPTSFPAGGVVVFDNPPLLYEGPDPTADSFLPMRWGPAPAGDVIPLPPWRQDRRG